MRTVRIVLLAVVVPVVLVSLGAVGVRKVQERAWKPEPRPCDELLVLLNAEISNELDRVLRGEATACGTTGKAEQVVSCILERHDHEVDPEDRTRPAFVAVGAGEVPPACQVGLRAVAPDAVLLVQASAEGEPRSFRIVLD